MSNTVIDTKSEENTFGFLAFKVNVNTTLTLVDMGEGKTGLIYESVFSGVKDGKVQGGPIVVSKNVDKLANESPQVNVIVSQFNKQAEYVSMHVTITVDIPVLGLQTIYSQSLAGSYGISQLC